MNSTRARRSIAACASWSAILLLALSHTSGAPAADCGDPQLTAEQKNKISHRALALAALVEELRERGLASG